MNLPNQITVGRLVLSAVLFVVMGTVCRDVSGGGIWYLAFSIYLVTMLSDGLDGYLARSRGQITAFGRIADPLADKVVVCGVLIMALTLDQVRSLVPVWIVIAVVSREFLVSGLRGYIEAQGTRFGASWEGKTKLITQAIYCGAIVFYPGHHFTWVWWVAEITLWGTLALTLYSAGSYIHAATRILRGAET